MELIKHIKNIFKNIGELLILGARWLILIGKGIFDVPMPKQRIEVEDDMLEPDDMMDEIDDFQISKALNPKFRKTNVAIIIVGQNLFKQKFKIISSALSLSFFAQWVR